MERIGGAYCGISPILLAKCHLAKEMFGFDLVEGIKKHDDWVAEITGRCRKYGYARSFLRGKVDYAKSNSKGTRGVYVNYILEDGRIYEVSEPTKRMKSERYFCTAVDGEVIKITRQAVDEWLNVRLG
jgi:hypothetical protein